MSPGLGRNWLSRRLSAFRTNKGPIAWLNCSLGAALIGSVFFAIGLAVDDGADSLANLLLATAARLVGAFFVSSLLILISAVIVAPPVTWIAARFRFEHPLFYLAFGAACGLAAGWQIVGDSRTFPFTVITLVSTLISGGSWGLLWWLVYRGHIGKGSKLDVSGIFE